MYKKHKRIIDILTGILLAAAVVLILPDMFSIQAKVALGVIFLMVFWWITRPVHLAVTALIPIIANSFFPMIPMKDMLSDYGSPIVLLILGASILTAAWSIHGLDRRIALKSLSVIGTSVKQQLVVWFLLSVVMSAFMPNMVVVTAFCPIVFSMMKYSGIEKSKTAFMLLMAVAWGAGIGGFATPMGGAMNLVAITNIENFTGKEFLYSEWVINLIPYLLVLTTAILIMLLLMKQEMKDLPGSREFYKKEASKIGKISRGEIISLILFTAAVLMSFARPLYAELLPGFTPPYAFLFAGLIAFFIKSKKGSMIIDWKEAAKKINWGLMILFAGGLALGGLIIDTGAAGVIAAIVSKQGTGIMAMVLIIVAIGMFLSNTSSNTAACAVLIPIVISVTVGLGRNPLPFVFLAAAACNSAFALPTSIRAVPVGYGLDTGFMFKKGIGAIAISYIVLAVTGYVIIILAG